MTRLTHAYQFSPEEGSCNVFSMRNNCCESLAAYGVTIQSVIQSYLKSFLFVSSEAYVWLPEKAKT